MIKRILTLTSIFLIALSLSVQAQSSKSATYTTESFQIILPSEWKTVGLNSFSPFSQAKDISQTALQIASYPTTKTSLSKKDRQELLEDMEKRDEKVLKQRTRKIQKIKAWEIFGETRIYGGNLRKTHEIWMIYDGSLTRLILTASPELFESSDKDFPEEGFSSRKAQKSIPTIPRSNIIRIIFIVVFST